MRATDFYRLQSAETVRCNALQNVPRCCRKVSWCTKDCVTGLQGSLSAYLIPNSDITLLVSVLKSASLGYTSLAATFMDATTGANEPRKRRIWERPTVAWHAENVPCAGAWVPTCPCGWVVSLQSTWTPEHPLMCLYLAATSPQRGQPSTGQRPRSLTGHTLSGLSAPSAPVRSAHRAGRDSSSRARSTNRHSSETTTTVTGSYPSFIPAADIGQWVGMGRKLSNMLLLHTLGMHEERCHCYCECSSGYKNPSLCLSFHADWG